MACLLDSIEIKRKGAIPFPIHSYVYLNLEGKYANPTRIQRNLFLKFEDTILSPSFMNEIPQIWGIKFCE